MRRRRCLRTCLKSETRRLFRQSREMWSEKQLFWGQLDHRAPVLPNKRVRARGPDRPKSVRCWCWCCCCHRLQSTFLQPLLRAFSRPFRAEERVRALKKGGSRSGFATKRDPKCDPLPPSSWFSNTFSSSACGATWPRGFILVINVFFVTCEWQQTWNVPDTSSSCRNYPTGLGSPYRTHSFI